MRIDHKAVTKAFEDLPQKQRSYIFKAIQKSVSEGVRLAKTMAPVDKGDLQRGIHSKFEARDGAIVASIEAAPSDRESQIKALAVEFGRSQSRSSRQTRIRTQSPNTGTTKETPFIRRTQSILGPKHRARLNRAIRKAVKEVGFK